MKLIIDIPEEIYTDVKENYQGNDVLYSAVKYGTPITFLKYRMKDYVFYNDKWLKERWEKEMELLGVDFSKHDEEIIKETVASVWGKPPYNEVLDKIQAEIERYQADCNLSCSDDANCKICDKITFDTICRIIDKYRKEQTDADSD